jgi:hypothetical protein
MDLRGDIDWQNNNAEGEDAMTWIVEMLHATVTADGRRVEVIQEGDVQDFQPLGGGPSTRHTIRRRLRLRDGTIVHEFGKNGFKIAQTDQVLTKI